MVALLPFLRSKVFEKNLQISSDQRFIKLAYDSKHMLKTKFPNQGSFKISYNSFSEAFIKLDTLQAEITTFAEYKSTSLDGLDDLSIRRSSGNFSNEFCLGF